MRFSSSLQGQLSHSALISRQDAELKLLEVMQRVLVAKAKCDKEYSLALTQLAQTAAKLDHMDSFLEDSQIHKTWKTMIEVFEECSTIFRMNSDSLASDALEKMTTLMTEKRASRKVYSEEHQRISSEIIRYQEHLSRAKNSYEQVLEQYKYCKTKFEDFAVKGKSNRKLEDLKERYEKASRKLHHVHNMYVLLLCEAADYERDFRTVLLPGLLEYQQSVQEDFIFKWKTMLSEVSELTNLSSEKFSQLHSKVLETLNEVDLENEYSVFVEKYKTAPLDALNFDFDSAIECENVGGLQAGKLAVNSFTLDSLKCKADELKLKWKKICSDINAKQSLLEQHENEVANIQKNSQEISIASRLPVLKRATDVLRKELNELRCQESWLQHQRNIIQQPLGDLDCQDDTNPNQINGEQKEDSKIKSSAFKDIFRKPFNWSKTEKSSQLPSITSSSNQLGGSESSISQKINSRIARRSSSKRDQAPQKADQDLTIEESTAVPELTFNPERNLEDEAWFHGVLPREEVVRLLVNDGDYLVRETTRNEERQIVLSVCWEGHKHFIVQTTADDQVRFEGPAFSSVQELIIYQHYCGSPVTNKSGAILRNSIFRERWELNNDDVKLLEKIGRGNFGDVYEARLESGQKVAVKTCRVTLPDEQKKKFLQEGRILKQYDHPNIVKFIGICVQKQPIMIVMELVPGGSLLNFVRLHKNQLTSLEQLEMCLDVASGMAYLESMNCIHRDLAARNCLVGHSKRVKISDFGMSREEEEYVVSDGMKQIPIKWTAPEALNFGKYTSLCDVWSFGVLCWEVFSFGELPYQGYSNSKAREMIDSGYRMHSPEKCPDQMYELMLQCWKYNPDCRPHFYEAHNLIKQIRDSLA